jgi:hypothetical protein
MGAAMELFIGLVKKAAYRPYSASLTVSQQVRNIKILIYLCITYILFTFFWGGQNDSLSPPSWILEGTCPLCPPRFRRACMTLTP